MYLATCFKHQWRPLPSCIVHEYVITFGYPNTASPNIANAYQTSVSMQGSPQIWWCSLTGAMHRLVKHRTTTKQQPSDNSSTNAPLSSSQKMCLRSSTNSVATRALTGYVSSPYKYHCVVVGLFRCVCLCAWLRVCLPTPYGNTQNPVLTFHRRSTTGLQQHQGSQSSKPPRNDAGREMTMRMQRKSYWATKGLHGASWDSFVFLPTPP